jgi:hypothetical protein
MQNNENIAKNGWSEYGRLVLAELQRLNQGQDDMKRDLDNKFSDLNNKISEFKTIEKEVAEIQAWKSKVIEVWSSSQMKQSKDEIYKQKGYYQRVIGVIITIQVIVTLLIAFKDKLF